MQQLTSSPAPRRAQRGTSLLEVLISVVILSFGLLGLAGLQLTSLKNNQSAMQRGMAVVQTYSIIEAMRTDPQNVAGGRYNIAFNDASPTAPTTFAQHSIRNWRDGLIAQLGEGATGAIACNAARLCTITVRWNDSRGSSGSATQTLATEAQL